jgi:hypothetical protein
VAVDGCDGGDGKVADREECLVKVAHDFRVSGWGIEGAVVEELEVAAG